jgi:DNA-directed RNA polymerase subunit alpha
MMLEPTFLIKVDSEKSDYGRYSIEPLSQGYGQTLGNSLRRVLLTSLPGAAISSVKIEGVKHQFTTIPGLKEDVIEFLLNVKRIRLSVSDATPVALTLSKKGPGEICAGDIHTPAGVVIVNPDLVLGTLSDKKAEIEMRLFAQNGYGYVTAEEVAVREVGVIPLDALYSPIVRVNYKVEATRVGRMTNLDKLVIEIWTDGTCAPMVGLTSAAKILGSYFMQIYEPKVYSVDEPVTLISNVSDEVLKMRIEELDIPTRIVNALSNGGIETIGQLLSTQRIELMKIKNLGVKSLSIVEDKLKEKGVALLV